MTAIAPHPDAERLAQETERALAALRARALCERLERERLQRLAKSPPVQPVPIFDFSI